LRSSRLRCDIPRRPSHCPNLARAMPWNLLNIPTDLVPPPLALEPSAGPFVDVAVAALRHAPLIVLCLLQLYSVGASGGEKSDEKCSKALGFNASSVPKDRSSQDLQFCQEHHKRTCCEREHSRQALGQFALYSLERSDRCSQMSKLALCSLCDGDVGVGIKAQAERVVLCPTFCRRWYQACADDFFTASGAGGLQPCSPTSLVCSPLAETTEDSASFCSMVGFSVSKEESDRCYDGVPAARSRGKGPRQPYTKPVRERPPWWRQKLDELQVELYRLRLTVQASRAAQAGVIATIVVLIITTWFVLRC